MDLHFLSHPHAPLEILKPEELHEAVLKLLRIVVWQALMEIFQPPSVLLVLARAPMPSLEI